MDEWWKRESILKFESPTSIFLVSPSSSGKTVLTKNMLRHSDGMFRIPPSKIFYCYSIWQNLYSEAADGSEIVHLMCVQSHHHQITVIHILQNVFHQGLSMRSASINAHYSILMKKKRDKNQILTLGKQIFPGKTKYFLDSFEKVPLLTLYTF